MTSIEQPVHRNAKTPPPVVRSDGSVDAAPRRVVQVLAAVTLLGLLFASILFFVAGAHKNDQISQLHSHGITIETSVTKCQGLLGGSGSNAAGFTCSVAFTLHGRRYVDILPGTGFYRSHARVSAVVVPSDPGLITTPKLLAAEQTSGNVFILPAVLLALALVGGGAAVMLTRRQRPADST